MFLWVLLLALVSLVASSPFEPHRLPAAGPWFEGWFTRIVDPAARRSVAVIVGSFMDRTRHNLSSTWVAALVSHPNGTMTTEQHFIEQASVRITDRGAPVSREPASRQPAFFEWKSSIGRLSVRDGNASLEFALPSGLRISASLRAREPWDAGCPNACGPEGWAGHLPGFFLPTHYFVHSLGSRAEYSLDGIPGTGLAHQESNWGARFPAAWVWVQGLTQDGSTKLLLTGGRFVVAGITADSYVLAYRSRGRSWNFRNIDLDLIESDMDACRGRLNVTARSPATGRELRVELAAPPSSFSRPLYVPTSRGFSDEPGSVESYSATADLRLSDGEELRIEQVALEFGGRYRCADDPRAAADALYV